MKLGRLPARQLFGLGDLADYALGKIPAPPTSAHYGHLVKDYPMDGNDQYGDCTIAAAAHCLQTFNAEVRNLTVSIPTEAECVSTYFQLTGGPDSGLVESDVLSTWKNKGLWSHKIQAYVPVKTGSIKEIHQATAFYGACYLGVQMTDQGETEFGNNEPWTVGGSVIGGHAIPIVGYDSNLVYVVTWGKIWAVTYPALEAYLEEAWAVIAPEFVTVGKGPLLDLPQLEADLSAI
jgi:hypothetical protein